MTHRWQRIRSILLGFTFAALGCWLLAVSGEQAATPIALVTLGVVYICIAAAGLVGQEDD